MTPAAGRLPAEWVAWPAAGLTAAAALVIVLGVLDALRRRGAAGTAFARHTGFGLQLLLAAGLLRLTATDSLQALAAVAAVIAIRQVVVRGIRAGAHAAGGRP